MLKNLTPHPVTVKFVSDNDTEELITIAPCATPARVCENTTYIGRVQTQSTQEVFSGISMYEISYGDVVDLPDDNGSDLLIVSRPVAEAMRGRRNDLVVLTGFQRDPSGNIMSADSIARVV